MTPQQAERLLPVLVHIQANLDGDLSLGALSAKAGLSQHHFHRMFRDALSETTKKYCERLRLERAAFALRSATDPVVQIALDVGFQSHEVFSRAFKRHFGVSPRQYRNSPTAHDGRTAAPSHRVTEASSDAFALSTIRIVELARRSVAFIRNVGPYEDVDPTTWSRISRWLDDRAIAGPRTLLALGHDAPNITAADALRFDACVEVDAPFEGDGEIACQVLGGGMHGSITHVGPLSTLQLAYQSIGEQMADLKGYRTHWLPVTEVYHAHRIDDLHTVLSTDICVPLSRVVS